MVNRDKLATAVAEARRFIERAEALPELTNDPWLCDYHPKEQGAIRRASMDLTRALADYRKG